MRIRRLVLVLAGVLLFSLGAFAQTYGGPRSYDRSYSSYRRDHQWRKHKRHDRREHERRHDRRDHRRHHHDHNNYRYHGHRR